MNQNISALGVTIVANPCYSENNMWEVVTFNKRGQWTSMSFHENETLAKQERSRLFKRHRSLIKKEMKK